MTLLPDKAWLISRVRTSRSGWNASRRPQKLDPIPEGGESVWDFPRPPAVQNVSEPIKVVFAGEVIAQTTRGLRVVETAGAPVYHFPPEDVRTQFLAPTGRVTVCEWKGAATYYDLKVGERISTEAAYTYPDPLDDLGQNYSAIAGWFAFYAGRVDEAFVGSAKVTPQPGGYYSGWVTPLLAGPIKGSPGSEGW
ncbi:MAG: DUF427 domain-containing protein [Pseudomonadota bacterium]